MSLSASSENLAARVPAGTTTWYSLVSASATGWSMSNAADGDAVRLRRDADEAGRPSSRGAGEARRHVEVFEPLALASPCTSAGAATATGRRVIGMRTLCAPSVHVSEPMAQVVEAARQSRVKVTVNGLSSSGRQRERRRA